MKRLIVVLVVLVLGCQTTGSVPEGITPEQASTEQEAVIAIIDQLTKTYNEEHFREYCSLWAEGATMILRSGDTIIWKRADLENRIRAMREGKSSIGVIKYNSKKVKLLSLTKATGNAELECSACNKGRIGKTPAGFKFNKQGGKWLITYRDTRPK